MQRPLVISLSISLAIIAAVSIGIYVYANAPPPIPISFTVKGVTHNFTVAEANATADEKGLMNATVTNKTFALFVFNSPYRWGFWMKNTYYPLDMIWIDGGASGGNVVYIQHDAIPCVSYDPSQFNCTIYLPPSVADYVIEARAGFANSSGLTNGSYVSFDYRG